MLVCVTATLAAEIKVLASPGVRATLRELVPEFERTSGHKVVSDFAVVAALKRRIESGEAFDIAILTPEVVAELAQQGQVAQGTTFPFARTGLGVAVAAGAPKPDISSVDSFKLALLNARAVAYSKEGASGTNFLAALKQLGIAEQMQPKLKPFAGWNPIEKGEADMVVSGVGPVMEMPSTEYLGPLPTGVQKYVVFTAGISAATRHADVATALLRFLTSPAATPAFKAKGLEQGGG